MGSYTNITEGSIKHVDIPAIRKAYIMMSIVGDSIWQLGSFFYFLNVSRI